MHSLTIRQQHNSQEPVSHLFDRCPSTDPSILLHRFLHWAMNHPFNPFISDERTIRPLSNELEIFGGFHRRFFISCLPESFTRASLLKNPRFIYY